MATVLEQLDEAIAGHDLVDIERAGFDARAGGSTKRRWRSLPDWELINCEDASIGVWGGRDGRLLTRP
jgi:hypothetical protein